MKPHSKQVRAAGRTPARPSNGFSKKTITALDFVGAVASFAAKASTLDKIWIKREIDPGLREMIMLAVARFNDAKYCSWAHHEWALIEGVPERQLHHVVRMDRGGLDPKTWLALTFARELVAAGFGPVSKELMQKVRATYTSEEIEDLAFVAKIIDLLNVSSNTFDAFVSRLNGKPSPSGRIIDEAFMSAAFCSLLPVFLVFFSRSSNRSIDEVFRRMITYTKRMDEEYRNAESGIRPAARTPARASTRPARARARRSCSQPDWGRRAN